MIREVAIVNVVLLVMFLNSVGIIFGNWRSGTRPRLPACIDWMVLPMERLEGLAIVGLCVSLLFLPGALCALYDSLIYGPPKPFRPSNERAGKTIVPE